MPNPLDDYQSDSTDTANVGLASYQEKNPLDSYASSEPKDTTQADKAYELRKRERPPWEEAADVGKQYENAKSWLGWLGSTDKPVWEKAADVGGKALEGLSWPEREIAPLAWSKLGEARETDPERQKLAREDPYKYWEHMGEAGWQDFPFNIPVTKGIAEAAVNPINFVGIPGVNKALKAVPLAGRVLAPAEQALSRGLGLPIELPLRAAGKALGATPLGKLSKHSELRQFEADAADAVQKWQQAGKTYDDLGSVAKGDVGPLADLDDATANFVRQYARDIEGYTKNVTNDVAALEKMKETWAALHPAEAGRIAAARSQPEIEQLASEFGTHAEKAKVARLFREHGDVLTNPDDLNGVVAQLRRNKQQDLGIKGKSIVAGMADNATSLLKDAWLPLSVAYHTANFLDNMAKAAIMGVRPRGGKNVAELAAEQGLPMPSDVGGGWTSATKGERASVLQKVPILGGAIKKGWQTGEWIERFWRTAAWYKGANQYLTQRSPAFFQSLEKHIISSGIDPAVAKAIGAELRQKGAYKADEIAKAFSRFEQPGVAIPLSVVGPENSVDSEALRQLAAKLGAVDMTDPRLPQAVRAIVEEAKAGISAEARAIRGLPENREGWNQWQSTKMNGVYEAFANMDNPEQAWQMVTAIVKARQMVDALSTVARENIKQAMDTPTTNWQQFWDERNQGAMDILNALDDLVKNLPSPRVSGGEYIDKPWAMGQVESAIGRAQRTVQAEVSRTAQEIESIYAQIEKAKALYKKRTGQEMKPWNPTRRVKELEAKVDTAYESAHKRQRQQWHIAASRIKSALEGGLEAKLGPEGRLVFTNPEARSAALDGVTTLFQRAETGGDDIAKGKISAKTGAVTPAANLSEDDFATLYSALSYGTDPTTVGLPKITKEDVNRWIAESVKGKNILPEDAINVFWSDPSEAYKWHEIQIRHAATPTPPVTGQKMPVKKGGTAPTAAPEVGPTPEPIVPETTGQTQYPILSDYLNGNLGVRWQQYRDELIRANPKYTPAKAGDLAAARIFKEYAPEISALEKSVRNTTDESLIDLYDQWVAVSEKSTIQNELVDMSGTRTLVADMDHIPDTVAKPLASSVSVPESPAIKPELAAEATPEPIKAEEDLVKQGQREPWEMSYREHRTAQYESLTPKQKDNWANRKTPLADITKAKISDDWDATHRQAVEQALAEGKPVPQEIINEYPDLAAKYAKGEQGVATPASASPEPLAAAKPADAVQTASGSLVGKVAIPPKLPTVPWGEREILARDIEVSGALYRTREATGLGSDYKGGMHLETNPARALAYADETPSGIVDRWFVKPSAKIYDENISGKLPTSGMYEASGQADVVIRESPSSEVIVFNRDAIISPEVPAKATEAPTPPAKAPEMDVQGSAKPMPIYSASRFRSDLTSVFRLDETQADAVYRLTEARARALGESLDDYLGRRLAGMEQGGLPGEGALQQADKRYYHGTGSAFDAPEPGKFDPNGLYGPGYYLTDNPEVAGSYASMTPGITGGGKYNIQRHLSEVKNSLRDLYEMKRQGIEPSPLAKKYVKPLDQDIAETEAELNRLQALAPNTRAVNVPEGLRLLDVDSPLSALDKARIKNAALTYRGKLEPSGITSFASLQEFVEALPNYSSLRGDQAYDTLKLLAGPKQVNEMLAKEGYDGIRYQGGKRIPMKDTAGNPIEHEAVVIFPESLGKITNALSGTPMGQGESGAFKGATRFLEDQRSFVHAFEQADISTILHELGHIFRRDLTGEDLGTIERWAGVSDGRWATEHEEKFARAWERYLADGQAPTPELEGVFAKLKAWMTEVYRAITGSSIDVNVTPEVKSVFDRMLREAPEEAATMPREWPDWRAPRTLPEPEMRPAELPDQWRRGAPNEAPIPAQQAGPAPMPEQAAGGEALPPTRPPTESMRPEPAPQPDRFVDLADSRRLLDERITQARAEREGATRQAAEFEQQAMALADEWLARVEEAITQGMPNVTQSQQQIAALRAAKAYAIKLARQLTADASQAGNRFQKDTFFDYAARSNLDELLLKVSPFVTWQTRNMPWYLQEMLRKPALGKTYVAYQEESDRQQREGNLPKRFDRNVELGPLSTWAEMATGRPGASLYGDPLSPIMSVGQQLKEPYSAEGATDAGKAINVARTALGGVSLYPWLQVPLQAAGVFGDQPYGDILPQSRLVRAATGALGNRVDPEAFWKERMTAAQGQPAVGSSTIEDYYISKRLAEMVEAGEITQAQALRAMDNPQDERWKQARAAVQREGDMLGALRYFLPMTVKTLTPEETAIREAQARVKEGQPYREAATQTPGLAATSGINASPEKRELVALQSEYYALGTPAQRATYEKVQGVHPKDRGKYLTPSEQQLVEALEQQRTVWLSQPENAVFAEYHRADSQAKGALTVEDYLLAKNIPTERRESILAAQKGQANPATGQTLGITSQAGTQTGGAFQVPVSGEVTQYYQLKAQLGGLQDTYYNMGDSRTRGLQEWYMGLDTDRRKIWRSQFPQEYKSLVAFWNQKDQMAAQNPLLGQYLVWRKQNPQVASPTDAFLQQYQGQTTSQIPLLAGTAGSSRTPATGVSSGSNWTRFSQRAGSQLVSELEASWTSKTPLSYEAQQYLQVLYRSDAMGARSFEEYVQKLRSEWQAQRGSKNNSLALLGTLGTRD